MEKQLNILKNLCARLPYRTICEGYYQEEPSYENGGQYETKKVKGPIEGIYGLENDDGEVFFTINGIDCELYNVKPYLRSMSDMTKEETRKYRALTSTSSGIISAEKIVDYLNSIHVDYMDELLSSGAAIKAPKSMYKKKKQS